MKDLAQERVNEIMMQELPDQFVEYMVMNKITMPTLLEQAEYKAQLDAE